MALVLGVYDPDIARREAVREKIAAEPFSGLGHLKRGAMSLPGLDIYWEAPASTPLSLARDQIEGRRRAAWIVGDFQAPYTGTPDSASRLLSALTSAQPDLGRISGQNGYYFALYYEEAARLVLAVDALGLFPLYYWIRGEICLFGTSPQLFNHHPSFVARPSSYAIASVLLVNHITAGRSLFEGVRRQKPGHYVHWTSERGACEVEANPVRMSSSNFDLGYAEAVDRVSELLHAFHSRLSKLPSAGFLLSGGQDSRLIAGFVARHFAREKVHAISLGKSGDQELQYAKKVARVYGWAHRYCDVDFDNYARHAVSQLKTESLQGPFASFDARTALQLVKDHHGPFLSGYLGDAVMGDRHLRAAQSPKSGAFQLEDLLGVVSAYGFPPNDVQRLLADGKAVVADVVAGLRQEWCAIEGLPFQKAWLFQLQNRQRFHVGSIIWRLSLGAWPLLPYYDRGLVDFMTSLPLDYLAARRIQADIIKRDFPRLATLPLDRNAVGADYLVTPLHRKFIPPLSEVSWTLYRLFERGRERRYYHRTYDFNSPGWRSVRQEGERYRDQAKALFDRRALDELLPSADATAQYENMVRDASKTKTLLGLVMWYGMNF